MKTIYLPETLHRIQSKTDTRRKTKNFNQWLHGNLPAKIAEAKGLR
jgi:hypothetical protein